MLFKACRSDLTAFGSNMPQIYWKLSLLLGAALCSSYPNNVLHFCLNRGNSSSFMSACRKAFLFQRKMKEHGGKLALFHGSWEKLAKYTEANIHAQCLTWYFKLHNLSLFVHSFMSEFKYVILHPPAHSVAKHDVELSYLMHACSLQPTLCHAKDDNYNLW